MRQLELPVAATAPIRVDCVIGPLTGLAANRAMLRGLAHEIKNPLGGLRGAAQLLDGELERRELREYTRIITHEADRLTRLVDRMMGPRRLPDRRPLNMHEVLEHVIRLVAVEYPDTIQFSRDYDPSLPLLSGDREGLIQALLNIVRNAAQAIPVHGIVTVRTRIERQYTVGEVRHRQVLRMDITDDGPGIAPALQEQVFDPLVTGRPTGAGLGLAIAREIASQHRGVIDFTSRPGETRFVLHLPFDHAG